MLIYVQYLVPNNVFVLTFGNFFTENRRKQYVLRVLKSNQEHYKPVAAAYAYLGIAFLGARFFFLIHCYGNIDYSHDKVLF